MNIPYEPDFPFRRCILGTAGLGGVWRRVDPMESVKAVLVSLERGVTAIDTAPAYGDAELFVGKALKQWKGAEPQISTKAGRLRSFSSNEGYYDYSPEGIEKSVVNSLKVLNVPVVDILFLHEPAEMNEDDAEKVIEKLLQLKDKRYVQKLGVGGNSPQWFEKYITTDVFDIVMEYNRLDACCINALHTSLPRYQLKGIEYYAASPLHMGLLGGCYDSFVNKPPDWLSPQEIGQARVVQKIAAKHDLQLASLAHRFLLTLPAEFKIVIGASNSDELQKTLADFEHGPLSKTVFDEILDSLPEKISAQ